MASIARSPGSCSMKASLRWPRRRSISARAISHRRRRPHPRAPARARRSGSGRPGPTNDERTHEPRPARSASASTPAPGQRRAGFPATGPADAASSARIRLRPVASPLPRARAPRARPCGSSRDQLQQPEHPDRPRDDQPDHGPRRRVIRPPRARRRPRRLSTVNTERNLDARQHQAALDGLGSWRCSWRADPRRSDPDRLAQRTPSPTTAGTSRGGGGNHGQLAHPPACRPRSGPPGRSRRSPS